jgi:hypothetical protein
MFISYFVRLMLALVLFRQITMVGGTLQVITVPGLGDNAMVKRPINIGNVTKLSVYFSGSGTITYIKDRICPTGGSFPVPPAATCSKDFYQNECSSNTACTNKYGSGSTCNTGTGIGNVCYKNGSPSGCLLAPPFAT